MAERARHDAAIDPPLTAQVVAQRHHHRVDGEEIGLFPLAVGEHFWRRRQEPNFAFVDHPAAMARAAGDELIEDFG